MIKLEELLKNKKFAALIQFVKFGLVGVSNTLISYGIEMLCFYVLFSNAGFKGIISFLSALGIKSTGENIKIVLTTIIAFLISVTNSYFLNNRFVFSGKSKKLSEHLISYLKTVLCYGLTGLIISPIIKVALNKIGIPYYIASLGSLVITIPLNFIMNKFWAFAKGKEDNNK